MYPKFKAEWNGRRVDYDKVYSFQCVDLIEQYCHELGVNGVYGNAIDYARKPSPQFAAHFSRVSDYKAGDVVVLNGLAGNPYGHIGIVDTDTTKFLEQNALGGGTGTGRNAIGVYRAIDKSRVAGVFRYKGTAPPIPAPAPARATVTLPASVQTWHLYYVGSQLRPNTSDVKATLAPALYGGITYKIDSWVGDYAVAVTTQMYGKGILWIKGTPAIIK